MGRVDQMGFVNIWIQPFGLLPVTNPFNKWVTFFFFFFESARTVGQSDLTRIDPFNLLALWINPFGEVHYSNLFSGSLLNSLMSVIRVYCCIFWSYLCISLLSVTKILKKKALANKQHTETNSQSYSKEAPFFYSNKSSEIFVETGPYPSQRIFNLGLYSGVRLG